MERDQLALLGNDVAHESLFLQIDPDPDKAGRKVQPGHGIEALGQLEGRPAHGAAQIQGPFAPPVLHEVQAQGGTPPGEVGNVVVVGAIVHLAVLGDLSIGLIIIGFDGDRLGRFDIAESGVLEEMAILVAMCRANYGPEFNPASVSLTHPAPDCSGKFYELFRCPVNFDAPDNKFTLTLESADKHLQGSNPLLSTLHDQYMINYLSQLDKTKIQERVRAAIIEQLPDGNINDHKVADALYMNVRTLQRRLQKEQTTFKIQLNSVRQELADRYIRDSSKGLAEISYLLGFSEMSSFSRAFKRWTGETPSHYRES